MLRHSVVLFASRVLAALVNLAAYIVAAQHLGVADFGRAVTAVVVASFAGLVCDIGTSSMVLRSGSRSSVSPNVTEATTILRTRMCATVLVGGAVIAIALVIAELPEAAAMVLAGAVYAAGYAQMAAGLADLQATRRVGSAAALLVVEKVTALSVTIVSLPALGAASIVVGQAGGVVVVVVCLTVRFAGSVPAPRLAGRCGPVLAAAVSIFAGGAVVQLLGLDIAIVDWMAGTDAAGAAALPSRLSVPMGLLASSVATASVVRFSTRVHDDDTSDLRRVTLVTTTATAVTAIPVVLGAGWFTDRFLPQEFADAGGADALRWAAVGVVVVSLSQPAGGALVARGRETALAIVIATSVFVGLAVSALGAQQWGAPGGMLGRSAAGVCAAIGVLWLWIGPTSQRPPRATGGATAGDGDDGR